MEQIFFLVLVAVVGLIRWVLQMAENKKNAEVAKRAGSPQPNAPLQRAPAETEEERIRRFMEALGVPTTTAPPPKVQPRQVVPKTPREVKRTIHPVDPFPRPRTGPWSPEPVVVVAPPPVVVHSPPPIPQTPLPTRETTVLAPTPAQRAAPQFEVHLLDTDMPGESAQMESATTTAIAGQLASAERGWAARLATAEGLRDAMILREIFGPPRSMQQVG